MSLNSWYARAESSAVGEIYIIEEKHNKMPGHMNAKEQAYTVLHHTFPKLIPQRILSLGSETELWLLNLATN